MAVIGSGPAALAAVRAWRKLDLDTRIDVIDIARNHGAEHEKKLTGVALKSFRGSAFSYDQKEFLPLNHSGMKSTVWPSAGFGGFSRVWGAALGHEMEGTELFDPVETLDPMSPQSSLFTSSGLKIARVIQKKYQHHLLGNLKPNIHHLAVDSSKCIKCGDCLTGCPTDAIWYAGDRWDSFGNIEFRVGNPVTKIVESQEFVELLIGEDPTPHRYSRVLLGCGPIGTASLLMKSGLLPKQVSMQDSATIFIPLLRLPRFEKRDSFALSQFSFSLSHEKLEQLHVQLYPDSRKMVNRAVDFLPFGKVIVRALWKCFSPFACAAIGYLDSKDSDAISLRLDSNNDFVLSPLTKKNGALNRALALKAISRNLRKIGLVVIPRMSKFGEPGEGYHFGSVEGLTDLGPESLVPGTSLIHVIDGSGLKQISAGPITSSIARRAEEIVKAILRDSKK